jgi:hypothetical protein
MGDSRTIMRANHPRKSIAVLVAAIMLFSGCASPVGNGMGADSPASPGLESPTSAHPTTATPSNDSTETVAVASEFTRVAIGETNHLEYRGENITVSFAQSEETVHISVQSGEEEKRIVRNTTESAATISWTWGNLQFSVVPVTAEQRDDQTVYVVAETWNASFIELDVHCSGDC